MIGSDSSPRLLRPDRETSIAEGESLNLPFVVGRDAELAQIRELIAGIDEEGASMIVRGAAGVGKSTVLSIAERASLDRGLRVIGTSGIESESMSPFAGLGQILEPIWEERGTLPDVQLRALLTALGVEAGPPPQLFLVALAALTLITDTAAAIPTVLIVDDVQWIDGPSIEVLAFVARRIQHDPVVIFAGLRDGHDVALSYAGSREVILVGLDESNSRALLDRAAGSLGRDTRNAILTYSQGNPLALVELPRARGAAGIDALSAQLPLTTRLERAFASRIMDLPARTRDTLLIAAINDQEDLEEILLGSTAMSGLPTKIGALEPARVSELVTLDDLKVRFHHPLVRSGILQNESPARRRSAHLAMSQVLHKQASRSVWHLAQSIEQPDDEIADRLFLSHRESVARGSLTTAVAILERSAELTVDLAVRGRRYLLASQHAFALGRVDLVDRLVNAAEHSGLSELDQARAEWLREIFTEGELGDSSRIAELCDLARRSAQSGDADLALDLLTSAALRSWWAIPGIQVRDQLVAVAESLVGSQDDARCIASIAVVEPLARGRQTLARLASLSPVSDAEQLLQLGLAARAVGAEVAAADYFDTAETAIRERGQLGLLPHVLAVNAAVGIDLGDWRRTAQSLDEAKRVASETGQPTWGTGVKAVEAVHVALRGDTGPALQLAAELEQEFAGRGANDFLCLAQVARGAAYLCLGQPAGALAELLPTFDQADPRHHPRESLSGLMLLVEAATSSGQADRVREIVASLELLVEEANSPVIATQLLYVRPMLADDAAAERLYLDGLSHDLSRWPWPRARLQLAYGNWLRRQHRAAESREPLRSALSTFTLIGASTWAQEARAGLRAAGERDDSTAEGASESLLNAHEMQVARLAADGLTNREIGQRLYISPRTVGSHLYRIYPKLGITSRAQIAERLSR